MSQLCRDPDIDRWNNGPLWIRGGNVRRGTTDTDDFLVRGWSDDFVDLHDLTRIPVIFDGKEALLGERLPERLSDLTGYGLSTLCDGLAIATTVGRLSVNHPLHYGLIERPLLADQFPNKDQDLKNSIERGSALLGTMEGTKLGWFSPAADPTADGTLYVAPVFRAVKANPNMSDSHEVWDVSWQLRQVGVDTTVVTNAILACPAQVRSARWDDVDGCSRIMGQVADNDVEAMFVYRALNEPEQMNAYGVMVEARTAHVSAFYKTADKAVHGPPVSHVSELLAGFSWRDHVPHADLRYFHPPYAESPLGVGGDVPEIGLIGYERHDMGTPIVVLPPDKDINMSDAPWEHRMEDAFAYFVSPFADILADSGYQLVRVNMLLYAVRNASMFHDVYPECHTHDIGLWQHAIEVYGAMEVFDTDDRKWVPLSQ